MKRRLLHIFTGISAIALSAFSVNAEIIEPSSYEISECKSYEFARSDSSIEVSSTVTYVDGVLTLNVYDFIEQCAAEFKVVCNDDNPGELHFIISDESEIPADCICPFDIKCTYEGILSGHYKIYLETPWGYVYLQTEADIQPNCEISLSQPSSVALMTKATKALHYAQDGTLKVSADGEATIEIFDAEGRNRGAFKVNGVSEISLASLPKGIYLVKATINGVTERLTLMR